MTTEKNEEIQGPAQQGRAETNKTQENGSTLRTRTRERTRRYKDETEEAPTEGEEVKQRENIKHKTQDRQGRGEESGVQR